MAVPGVPVLVERATTEAPASFFRKLFESGPGDAVLPDRWTALLHQLESLGERRIRQLLISDQRSSWVVFLSEDLKNALAFGGRPLPQPLYSMEQDDEDIRSGRVVRELATGIHRMKLLRLERSKLDVDVELEDDSGTTLIVTFERALRIRTPESRNEVIAHLTEIEGVTGRKWFVFEPIDQQPGRKMAVQASAVSWRAIKR
jgi:hypothetical protein